MEDGSELEQLNLQNGPGRELIRVNDVVSVFEPDVQPYSLRSKHINGPIPSVLLIILNSLPKPMSSSLWEERGWQDVQRNKFE